MLKSLKNKGKVTKDTKKDTENTKKPQEQVKDEDETLQEQSTDLVDTSQLKQQTNKAKQVKRTKNDYQLEEKQIDLSTLKIPQKEEKVEERTSWVANSVEQVIKTDFKMENIEHEFESLTDQDFNQKNRQKFEAKQKQQRNKPKLDENTGIKFANIEKSADQLRMERANEQLNFSMGSKFSGSTPSTGFNQAIKVNESASSSLNFTNTALGKQFAPIEKTPQQLRMEQAERRQQEIALKKPATSWIGGKKAAEPEKPATAFKTSAWVTIAANNPQGSAPSVNYAPLEAQKPKQSPQKQQTKTSTGWAASNSGVKEQGGFKFAPLQVSDQEKKLLGAGRQEQEMVFTSKKQIEERKKKREEKEAQLKAATTTPLQ